MAANFPAPSSTENLPPAQLETVFSVKMFPGYFGKASNQKDEKLVREYPNSAQAACHNPYQDLHKSKSKQFVHF